MTEPVGGLHDSSIEESWILNQDHIKSLVVNAHTIMADPTIAKKLVYQTIVSSNCPTDPTRQAEFVLSVSIDAQIQRVQELGDVREWMNTHDNELRRRIKHGTHEHPDAEDLLNDLLIKMWEKARSGQTVPTDERYWSKPILYAPATLSRKKREQQLPPDAEIPDTCVLESPLHLLEPLERLQSDERLTSEERVILKQFIYQIQLDPSGLAEASKNRWDSVSLWGLANGLAERIQKRGTDVYEVLRKIQALLLLP